MTYSCCDFFDDICAALDAHDTNDDGIEDNVSTMGDICLKEIDRLRRRDEALKVLSGPANTRLERVHAARVYCALARDLLREAGADHAANYVARALKSVDGAERHARNLEMRSIVTRSILEQDAGNANAMSSEQP